MLVSSDTAGRPARIPAINALPQAQVTAICSSRDLDGAVKTHEVIFAADKSAALGRPVKLAEIK